MLRCWSRGLSLDATNPLGAKESLSIFHVLQSDASLSKGWVTDHQVFGLPLRFMPNALGVLVGTLRSGHLSLCQARFINSLAQSLHMRGFELGVGRSNCFGRSGQQLG